MILRKPYALLIKFFKVIHIIMFVFFTYFVFAIRKIYIFFLDYVKNSNFTYVEGMSLNYINILMYVMVLLILAMGIMIFFLMKKKNKPVLFYRLLIGYSFILLISFIYFHLFFKSLDTTLYEPLRIVINRDISLFIYIINYFFVAFTFIRGFGFDIKKFSFEQDKKELHLEETDSEEYELQLNIDKDDIHAYLNKQKRELGYYIKINAPILITILVIIVISLSLYFYYDFFVINKTYKEKQKIDIGVVSYTVNNSYITKLNKNGNVIDKNFDFLIINIDIQNNSDISGYLNEQSLRVFDGASYYYPSKMYCSYFDDIGNCYSNQELKQKVSNNYILVFRIKKDIKNIILEILKDASDVYSYAKVKLDVQEISKNVVSYRINNMFTINNNDFAIENYSLHTQTSYIYEECNNNACSKYTKLVLPKTGDMVLEVDISNLDKLDDDFLENYIALKIDGKFIKSNELNIIGRHDNNLYISVPSYIKNASSIALVINMRLNEYDIILEG